ncbi:hypothetical protein [Rhizohabitans arisaemae]|uniref:hypothetical protein n=1 Tax=Rhizohabitans arisaemae TaxID=2720610 RepID=UPI0024B0EED9|nr:hypothetical protein [Rhizohabitans arisaemae]
MKTRRPMASLSASVLLAAGLVAGTAGPAFAVPTGCSHRTYYQGVDRYAESTCSGGTGQHRIQVIQQHHLAGPIPSQGPWQPVGTPSTTWIPGYPIVTVYVATQ